MNPENALTLALEWAERGVPAFPVAISWDSVKAKTNKVPTGGHGHQDATLEPAQLRTQFGRLRPRRGVEHGVGLWPGPAGFAVLDDDGGADAAGLVPVGYVVITASGGRHWWVRKPEPVEVDNHSPWPGVDVRADRGWVVAPGTEAVLMVNGGPAVMTWQDPGGFPTNVVECPPEVWSALRFSNGASAGHWRKLDRDALHPADAAMLIALEAVGAHSPYLANSGGQSYVAVTRPGKASGTSASIGFVGPGLVKMFTPNWPPFTAEKVYDLDQVEGLLKPAEPSSDNPHAHLHLINWSALWAADEDEIEDRWLLEPLIPARRQMALYAGAKVGKSDLMLWLCCRIALGLTLDGHKVPPRHVLYLDYEMTPEDLRDRLEYFGYGPEYDLSHLHYASLPTLDALDSASGGDQITADAAALGVDLVVIDTAGRAVTGDENDADTYRALYARTGRRLKTEGIALVRLDHAGKDVAKGQRGSSGKNDDVDVVLQLTRVEGGAVARATHRRMDWYPQQTSLTREEDYLEGSVHWALVKNPLTWPAGTKDLVNLMAELGCPLMSVRKTATWLKDKGHPRRMQVVNAAMRYRSQAVEDL